MRMLAGELNTVCTMLTQLVESRSRSLHHRFFGIDAEQSEGDVVQPGAEDGTLAFKVAASERSA